VSSSARPPWIGGSGILGFEFLLNVQLLSGA
jgi:hypothetical protein